ncbi:uncharacterized protein [Salminus brasiliensis]|uniref:uncharacterized protein n=1 Tax=Salminus brasiliensis TaxID=930266 RepID=UPI003B838678
MIYSTVVSTVLQVPVSFILKSLPPVVVLQHSVALFAHLSFGAHLGNLGKMVRHCAVHTCPNAVTKRGPVSFHRLPYADLRRLFLWLRFLRRDVNTSLSALRRLDLRICSDHFSPQDFSCPPESPSGEPRARKKLRRTAVPSRNEPPTVSGAEQQIAEVSVVLSADDVCLQAPGSPSINQEHSNDEDVLNITTQDEDLESCPSRQTQEDEAGVDSGQECNDTSVASSEEEANAEEEEEEEGDEGEGEGEGEEALSDTEDDTEGDPADSEYLPSSSCESSKNSEDEVDEVSHKPFQSTFRPDVWCLDCEAHAGISCTIKKHQRVYCCLQCVSEGSVEVQCLEDLPVRFDSRISFHKHAITVHGAPEQPPEFKTCEDCGKLNRVEDEHHVCECKIKPFSCELCSKRFLTENGRKVHYRRLHGNYTHFCKYCMMNFTTKESKLQHEQVHSTRGLPYRCPSCSLRFKDFRERNQHLKSHGGRKGYLCSTCGMRFSKATSYERHLLVHSGEKPYRCEVCERSFNQAGHLKSHMRLHTGEKPFMCEQCGECFNHNVSLKNHLLRQHGIDTKYLPTKEGKRIGRPFSDVPVKRRFKGRSEMSAQPCSSASAEEFEGGDAMCDRGSDSPEESQESRCDGEEQKKQKRGWKRPAKGRNTRKKGEKMD